MDTNPKGQNDLLLPLLLPDDDDDAMTKGDARGLNRLNL